MIRSDAACGGACTTCPSGLTGTLVAIVGILKAEVDSKIVVIPVRGGSLAYSEKAWVRTTRPSASMEPFTAAR